MKITELLSKFDVSGRLVLAQPFGNGNINDTYLAVYRNTFDETQVILQRVNKKVFKKPEDIMSNMHVLCDHCHRKLEREADRSDRVWQMPRIVRTKDGKDFVRDSKGDVWRVITRVLSAHAFDTAQSPEHAMECGAALGHFHYLVSDLDPRKIKDPLPGFHITPLYLKAYDRTLDRGKHAKALLSASTEARRLAKFVEERRPLATAFTEGIKKGELKVRMFHGDPKVNNIMIDDFTGKGTAMIDLDTVAPGLVQIDFGDAIRSICNPAGEEAANLNEVILDETLCSAFCKGYMREAREFMSAADRESLFDAIRLLPFELGLRFFQDYLAGDVYFKVSHPEQNLNRARVQFRLCESIEAREHSLRKLLSSL